MPVLKVGDIVEGKVTGVENYGIFVSVENYTGLIHISEISAGFVKDVNKIAKIGDTIKTEIIEVDNQKKQLKLSVKPFEENKKKKQREKIAETNSGFTTLGNNLNKWIEFKINEISSKK